MKITKAAAIMTLALSATSAKAYILPVFDGPGFQATLQVLTSNAAQVLKLGQILGVNTQQLNTVIQMRDSIRRVGEVPTSINGLTENGVRSALAGIPGLGNIDVSKLMKPDSLGMFYGMTAGDWQNMVMRPREAIFDTLKSRAIQRIGREIGLTNAETGYAQWVANLPSETRSHMRERIAEDLASFAFERLQRDMQTRQQQVVVDQAKVQALVEEAKKDGTLNEKMALSNTITAQGNEQALKASAAQAKAAETTNTQLHSQLELIRRQNQIMEAEARTRAVPARRPEY